MIVWLLAAIALLLFAWEQKERFTDPDECTVAGVTPKGNPCVPKVERPSLDSAVWKTRIDAEARLDANDEDYVRALQLFYDKVYVPATVRPTDRDVEAFLSANAGALSGVDISSLRRIIASGFRIELTKTAAMREREQIMTTGVLAGFEGSNLQPGSARDQVYTRTESIYTPADMRKGELPEGLYAPIHQTTPSRPGDLRDNSTSWTQVSPMSVCAPDDLECMKNVL